MSLRQELLPTFAKSGNLLADPELPFSAVHNFMRNEGIRLTLTGHQHVGDAKSVTSFVFSSNFLAWQFSG